MSGPRMLIIEPDESRHAEVWRALESMREQLKDEGLSLGDFTVAREAPSDAPALSADDILDALAGGNVGWGAFRRSRETPSAAQRSPEEQARRIAAAEEKRARKNARRLELARRSKR
jgi:hypothetical protein